MELRSYQESIPVSVQFVEALLTQRRNAPAGRIPRGLHLLGRNFAVQINVDPREGIGLAGIFHGYIEGLALLGAEPAIVIQIVGLHDVRQLPISEGLADRRCHCGRVGMGADGGQGQKACDNQRFIHSEEQFNYECKIAVWI